MTHLPLKAPDRATRLAPLVFTLTIFLSASLLFFVQPLFAKIVLPVIGGAPAVWTTAMLFFQTVLIGGYLYAHLSTRYLAVPVQMGVHVALWAAALFFLPPSLPETWRLDADGSIALQTLGLFAIGVGVPFALLSSNAPLIQSWYARTGGPSADDPYFLYGASNLGSLLALLAFPLVAERYFGAGQIAFGFSAGFFALGAGLIACGTTVFGRHTAAQTDAPVKHDTDASPLSATTIGYWMLLAFVPSSLMLAVTSKMTTDIGAVPLLWVIPLALFLLTFVMTFSNKTPFRGKWLTYLAQISVALGIVIFSGVSGARLSPGIGATLLFVFFAITIWAHRTLYEARPPATHLTAFYVTMSVGGALGGLFNSILAPLVFNALYEGNVTLFVALALVFQPMLKLTPRLLILGLAAGVVGGGIATALLSLMSPEKVMIVAVVAAFALITATLLRHHIPAAITAAVTAIVLPISLTGNDTEIFKDRSFFGLHRVRDLATVRTYSNGTTLHGAQILNEDNMLSTTPTTYYHPTGPMGQVMTSVVGQNAKSVGIVGLGVGSLACYAQPGQDWHFYEIDAMVDRVARDPDFFTFLSTCTPDAPTHLGDARVVLQDQTELRFDVLIIDAYSSDAVPVHLTTLEAMALYLDRLSDDGVLIFHISNGYYDIDLPLSRSADALGVRIWQQFQKEKTTTDPGFQVSEVVMITRDPANVAPILDSGLWSEITSDGGDIWTDDKANALSILKPGVLR